MNFRQAVAWIVKEIPAGRVMTYGQVAAIIGYPRAARAVGGALHFSADTPDLPWWRIINRLGRVSTRCEDHTADHQIERLRAEGIDIDDDGQLLLLAYQWWPSTDLEQGLQMDRESSRRMDAFK